MDKNKISFYGTPLSKCINDEQTDNVGSSSLLSKSRKTRLDYQQTVRDGQGRQRFHGAFTGGFSAGYYNTVDSAEGFQPRQFVTNRQTRSDGSGSSKFSHRPEDYMDDEDLGEFGIAPRKIRVTNLYTTSESTSFEPTSGSESSLVKFLKPTVSSIGEQILKRMKAESESGLSCIKSDSFKKPDFAIKNDFHGLGYAPLEASKLKFRLRQESRSINPLVAVLGDGKRLKISGEAFGSGVLDDDEDYPDTSEAYGYDDMRNYEFKSKLNFRDRASQRANHLSDDQYDCDYNSLPGFVLAKNLNAMKLCDEIKDQYPLPSIPENWRMPTRTEPHLPPSKPNPNYEKLNFQSRQAGNIFSKKFISSAELKKTEGIQTKSGLVLYSDLKAIEPSLGHQDSSHDVLVDKLLTKATLTRITVEWRPCSLLCKRFNVPNPFPDNTYCGVDYSSLARPEIVEATNEGSLLEASQKPATMEVKRSIFDVTFADSLMSLIEQDQGQDSDSVDSEDEPQIIDLGNMSHNNNSISDEDPDVVVVAPVCQEPELIVLSSSSESRSNSPTNCAQNSSTAYSYGPDLPPTLKTLIDLDHRRSSSRRRGKKKKRKKHKKRRD